MTIGRMQRSTSNQVALREFGWFAREISTSCRAHELVASAGLNIATRLGLAEIRSESISEIRLPQIDDSPSYQALHFDGSHVFNPVKSTDTHIAVGLWRLPDAIRTGAQTRIASLDALSRSRTWPSLGTATDRITAYGVSHGSALEWEFDSCAYSENKLWRLVDAIDASGELTSFRQIPREMWFEHSRAGNEFANEQEEQSFSSRHSIALSSIEVSVTLAPGTLLVLDNTRVCHARRGRREKGELMQLVYGQRDCGAKAASDVARSVLLRLIGAIGPDNP